MFIPEFKAQVVLEVISGAKSAADACRQHNLKPQLRSDWKAQFLANAARAFQSEEQRSREQARAEQKREVIVKRAARYPVNLICQMWDFPHSSYYYQPKERDEEALKATMKSVAGAWPT